MGLFLACERSKEIGRKHGKKRAFLEVNGQELQESGERAKEENNCTCEKLMTMDIIILVEVKKQRKSTEGHDFPEEEKRRDREKIIFT